jgi:hypothetical protein
VTETGIPLLWSAHKKFQSGKPPAMRGVGGVVLAAEASEQADERTVGTDLTIPFCCLLPMMKPPGNNTRWRTESPGRIDDACLTGPRAAAGAIWRDDDAIERKQDRRDTEPPKKKKKKAGCMPPRDLDLLGILGVDVRDFILRRNGRGQAGSKGGRERPRLVFSFLFAPPPPPAMRWR